MAEGLQPEFVALGGLSVFMDNEGPIEHALTNRHDAIIRTKLMTFGFLNMLPC